MMKNDIDWLNGYTDFYNKKPFNENVGYKWQCGWKAAEMENRVVYHGMTIRFRK